MAWFVSGEDSFYTGVSGHEPHLPLTPDSVGTRDLGVSSAFIRP